MPESLKNPTLPESWHLPWGALGAHLLVFVILVVSHQYFVLDHQHYFILGDDAMISMRYAQHWAAGHGIYWNDTPTPEGYTNFLMVVLMAAAHKLAVWLGMSLHTTSLLVLVGNLLLQLGSLVLLARLVAGLTTQPQAVKWAVWALALNCQFVLWGKYGFETSLLVFFSIAALLSVLRGRPWLASLLLAGAVLARDDAALLAFAVGVTALYGAPGHRLRDLIRLALLPLLAFCGHTIFRLHYYGMPLPNTYYLKATGLPISYRLGHGSIYVAGMLGTIALAVWVLQRVLRSGRQISAPQHVVLLASLGMLPLYTLYVLWVGGDAFGGSRLFSCLWFAPCLAVGLLAEEAAARAWHTRWLLAALLLVTISPLTRDCAAGYYHEAKFVLATLRHGPGNYANLDAAALVNVNADVRNTWQCSRLRQDAAARGWTHPSMAVYYAGMAPYFCPEFEAIDLLGKSDAWIARTTPHLEDIVGHNKYDYEYSLTRYRPSYILSLIEVSSQLHDKDTHGMPGSIVHSHAFQQYYRPLPQSAYIFVRNDAP